MKKITTEVLDQLSSEAAKKDRLRLNKNYHPELSDPINRMLNAFEPGTYIQPHKHESPDKREVFVLLRGKLGVVQYLDDGSIGETTILDTDCPVVEFSPNEWHSVVSLEKGTVVYEIKDGPYEPLSDKNFASWAPKEGEDGCAAYVKKLESLFL